EYHLCPMREIELTRNKVALVDDADYESLSRHKWYAHIANKSGSTWYALRMDYSLGRGKGRQIWMHRQILGLADRSMITDHIDGNGLNNQRSNIRACTYLDNNHNRSKKGSGWKSVYKGVTNHAATGKWRARISVNNKSIYLGLFAEEYDAATAYNLAAHEYFG